MKETFIVKHAVGGEIFIDTNKEPVPYAVEPRGDGFLIAASVPWSERIERLLGVKDELNVFIFREHEAAPTVKTWYYVKDGPVGYDRASGRLTIAAESRIEYVPDRFLGA